jgi:hypothetical protein
MAMSQADASTRSHEHEERAELLERWSRMGPMFIMIVALFGFGLHYSDGEHGAAGEISIRWSEVPAILIVFILAEFGVRLVRESSAIGEKVTFSSQAVQESVEETRALQDESKKLVAEASDVFQKMSTISEISTLLGSDVYRESLGLRHRMGIELVPFWNKLGIFVRSWTPGTAPVHHQSGRLLETLFNAYVGDDHQRSGSVRSDYGAVKCITSDSVYSKASEQWLEQMLEYHKDETVVVWAVSRLLPSEFALPDLWLDGNTGTTSRSKALNAFIDAVIGCCKKSAAGKLQYRRVTVLDETEALPYYFKKQPGDEHSRLSDSLDHWLIWDPRVRNLADTDVALIDHLTPELLNLTNRLKEPHIRSLKWNDLKGLCKDRFDDADAKPYSLRILPAPTLETNDQGIRYRRIGAAGDEKLVLSCDASTLGMRVPDAPNFLKEDMPESLREALKPACTKAATLGPILAAMGWRSMRNWYCDCMHTDNEAWWAIKQGDGFNSPFDPEFFSELELTWNGTKVLTLDVLLIGTKKAVDATPSWHGAVVSNLRFDRTECTVDLKLDSDQLAKIASRIQTMCETGPYSGRWREFRAVEATS